MKTQTATLTYETAGHVYGEVRLFCRGQLIARRVAASVLRMTPEQVKSMADWVGFNEWRWLGIEVDSLPCGLTIKDVREAYQVARDEMIEAGMELPN